MTNLSNLEKDDGLWYLASPYSKYPEGPKEAFRRVCRVAGLMIANGIFIYSPIAHSHSICEQLPDVPLDDYNVWLPVDEAVIKRCSGIIVLCLDSWETSHGVQFEIEKAQNLGLPIYYITEELIETAYG